MVPKLRLGTLSSKICSPKTSPIAIELVQPADARVGIRA